MDYGFLHKIEGVLGKYHYPAELNTVESRSLRSCYTILVVDDMPVNILLTTRLLDKLGYRFGQAENGLQAVQAVIEGAYDLVLMDCQMPVMDGYEATRKIRELPDSRRYIPIVATSALDTTENIGRCSAVGMNGFLPKPIEVNQVDELIVALIAGQDRC